MGFQFGVILYQPSGKANNEIHLWLNSGTPGGDTE